MGSQDKERFGVRADDLQHLVKPGKHMKKTMSLAGMKITLVNTGDRRNEAVRCRTPAVNTHFRPELTPAIVKLP